MTDTIIKVDLSSSPYDNDMIHNRWHPDIPMVATVKPGQDFIIECYDWTGGFIKNNDSAADVRDIDLTIVHFLSGPIGVKGAEPGDLQWVSEVGMGTIIQLVLGMPGETDTTILETIDFLKKVSSSLNWWKDKAPSELISINYAQAQRLAHAHTVTPCLPTHS